MRGVVQCGSIQKFVSYVYVRTCILKEIFACHLVEFSCEIDKVVTFQEDVVKRIDFLAALLSRLSTCLRETFTVGLLTFANVNLPRQRRKTRTNDAQWRPIVNISVHSEQYRSLSQRNFAVRLRSVKAHDCVLFSTDQRRTLTNTVLLSITCFVEILDEYFNFHEYFY